MTNDLVLLKHQEQLITYPWIYKTVEFFFLIGGYASGKSMAAVALILVMAKRYEGHEITGLVCSTTQTLFRKTIWMDLIKILKTNRIKYHYNQIDNIIKIGTVSFLITSTETPENIFGPNGSFAIFDEIDELPLQKAQLAFQAVSERVRVPLPDNRRPFMAFTTTAQGMRGAFAITQDLRAKGIQFIIIRGLTKLNTFLDPAYYDRMYALYTENERLAFLEGQFVNLTSGRVYPAYSEPECTVDDFEILPDDVLHIGQDLNISGSCATAIVKRDKKLFVVKTWQFKDFSQSATIIRQSYPNNIIYYYPDASSRMLITAYLAMFSQHGFHVVQNNVNPPIEERIFLVNKAFSIGVTKRFKSVKDLDLCWKTRVYDKTGKPEKSSVHPSHDDYADGMEYSHQQIIANDPDFYEFYSLATHKRE